jgi:hypothetical protein
MITTLNILKASNFQVIVSRKVSSSIKSVLQQICSYLKGFEHTLNWTFYNIVFGYCGPGATEENRPYIHYGVRVTNQESSHIEWDAFVLILLLLHMIIWWNSFMNNHYSGGHLYPTKSSTRECTYVSTIVRAVRAICHVLMTFFH